MTNSVAFTAVFLPRIAALMALTFVGNVPAAGPGTDFS